MHPLIDSHRASLLAANARKLMNAVSAQHLSHKFSISYRKIIGKLCRQRQVIKQLNINLWYSRPNA